MNEEIELLNQKIKEHIGQFAGADEVLFNIGVELGRYIERNKIETLRLPFFIEQERIKNEAEIKHKAINSVNAILQTVLVQAHKEQVEDDGYITYDAAYGASNEPLSKDIEKKFDIAYKGINQATEGEDFRLSFALKGKIGEIFSKHKVGLTFTTFLKNKRGEVSESITSEDNIESIFYRTSISLHSHNENMSLKEVSEFVAEVEKLYMFFCIKFH